MTRPMLRSTFAIIVAVIAVALPAISAHGAGNPSALSAGGQTRWSMDFGPTAGGATIDQLTCDVNRDGRSDAIDVYNGLWTTKVSDGLQFVPYGTATFLYTTNISLPTKTMCEDMTGDRRADAITVVNGRWHVAPRRSGSSFSTLVSNGPFGATAPGVITSWLVGDVTGDGIGDEVVAQNGVWSVAPGIPRGDQDYKAGPPAVWTPTYPSSQVPSSASSQRTLLSDGNGDGKSDLWYVNAEDGVWRSRFSTGTSFSATTNSYNMGFPSPMPARTRTMFADVNGDQRPDAIEELDGEWTVSLFNPLTSSYLQAVPWDKGFTPPVSSPDFTSMAADANGDGKADPIVSDSGGDWRVAASPSIPSQIKSSSSGWVNTWGDDFTGWNGDPNKLDADKWSTEHYDYWFNGQNTRGLGLTRPYSNMETGTYDASNSTVAEGVLTQRIGATGSGTTTAYTIGSVNSLGRISSSGAYVSGTGKRIRYGYVEARIKVPSSGGCSGCWPAFFMLPAPPSAPTTIWSNECFSKPEELDIFEFFPNLGDNLAYYNVHWGACDEDRRLDMPGTSESPLPSINRHVVTTDLTGSFHTYGILWTQDYTQFFVDGIAGDKVYVGVPTKALYLILTLQRGRDNAIPGLVFPPTLNGVNMQTEYVRVYE